MTPLDRVLTHRRVLEQSLGRDPGLEVAAADLAVELPPGTRELAHAVSLEMDRSRRGGRPFAVLHLTVPGVCGAAAACGALFGEAADAWALEAVREAVRESDTVVHVGAGEIAVVLPETRVLGAEALASRLAAATERAFAGGFLGRTLVPAPSARWQELAGGESA